MENFTVEKLFKLNTHKDITKSIQIIKIHQLESTEREYRYCLINTFIKEVLLTTKDKVMELLIFKAEIFTKAPGKKAK
jgi:hypothetical protein